MGSRSSRRCSRLISLNVRDRCVRRGSIQYITSRRKRAPRAPHTTSRWTPKRASSPSILISLNVRDRCVRRGSIQYITSRRKRAPRAPHTTSRWTPKRASSPPNLLVGEHLLAQHARARAHRVEQLARTALQACNMLVGEEHLLA